MYTINIYSRLCILDLIRSKELVQYLKDNNITIYILTLIIVNIIFIIFINIK